MAERSAAGQRHSEDRAGEPSLAWAVDQATKAAPVSQTVAPRVGRRHRRGRCAEIDQDEDERMSQHLLRSLQRLAQAKAKEREDESLGDFEA